MNLIFKNTNISTVAEYEAQPRESRYWKGLYLKPFCLKMGEWPKFKKWAKKNHPIQYFFREFLNGEICHIEHLIHYKWIDIRDWFSPQNRVTIRSLNRGYHDKSSLISEFLAQMLIDYIEVEKCFEVIDYSETPESKKQLERLYNYFKNVRNQRDTEVDSLHTKLRELGKKNGDEDIMDSFCREKTQEENEVFMEIFASEEKIDKELTANLVEVVQIRESLWT